MDYEKKYKEALDRAKRLYEQGTITESLSYVFPELKESEDERVRKALIDFFYRGAENGEQTNGVCDKDILAWLEKQKEFVSADFDDVWETADCDELTAPLEKYSKDAIKEMCHAWYDKGIELERKNWLEKQGEQKPIPFNDAHIIDPALNDYCCKQYDALHKENGGILSFARLQRLAMDIYSWCKKQGKQKSFDYEKANIQQKDFSPIEPDDFIEEYYQYQADDIIDMVTEKSAEWSEEDENRFSNLISLVKCSKENEATKKGFIDFINKLKSIRPQKRRKPSEEQMSQMIKDATDVTVHIDAGGYPYIPQMELYDYDKDMPLAKKGDKVKVIVIKEN